MTNSINERAARRLTILNGINGGLSHEKIAEKMGIQPRMLRRDLKRMRRIKDPELKQAYKKALDRVQAKKLAVSNRPGEKFHDMTGMTFKEKSFSNMMSYYKPELSKILKSENEYDAIRKLSKSVKKTMKRNGIIGKVRKNTGLTRLARTYLSRAPTGIN
ncbi:MAG: hypothetical protein ACEROO_08335 [Candidatus Bathyarchaeota archaeon]